MADFTPGETGPRAGEAVVFWTWMVVVVVGLAVMIAVPLIGR